ncbi:GntR family transcriptional regulator [Microbacterium album]|uniref:GntR family transcriptional regulator n=1 Tax=Microbacterium album TaxID=2053191 RepID=A0A917IBE7_9MICO|nr:GntR family transcriptional regulator [Microbacterium album]GGH33488.1 GntR family transcriptional regulator [Microbacterium album]
MSTPLLPPRSARRVADEVFRILRDRIVSGALSPGSRLDIDAITAEFDVSRTPVREAVLQLEGAGLVVRQPYRGPIVAGVDPGRLEEITALRIQLEGLAAELGAPRLAPSELEAMETALRDLDALGAVTGGSVGDFNELNWRFHRILYAAAAAPVLLRTLDALRVEADRIRLHYDFPLTPARDQHRRILDACARHDAPAARQLTQQHILEAHLHSTGNDVVAGGPLAAVLRTVEHHTPTERTPR